MSGISDLDKYSKQFPTAVTFEPGTLNLEPNSLGNSNLRDKDMTWN
jgi:hypothetical protein